MSEKTVFVGIRLVDECAFGKLVSVLVLEGSVLLAKVISIGHVPHELVVVDLPIAIRVRVLDHLVDILLAQLLTKLLHDDTELLSRDQTVSVLVEQLESLLELLLLIGHIIIHIFNILL